MATVGDGRRAGGMVGGETWSRGPLLRVWRSASGGGEPLLKGWGARAAQRVPHAARTLDDLTHAHLELEGVVAVAGGVELGAVGQRAGVVDLRRVWFGWPAVAS